ncbi:hypothetical protein [Halopseudomonas pelagia]|uniref:Type IV pilus assembly protein PilW n=1 Tax=Halopseudomonas pelagia TaxID=553151 RepID=A0AA91Z799_9GAMM|nr:hypothetical protein [Halopseudomonas pelagia]PCD00819.1 hypothetical protein CO192_03205 [Halopseudomonas pelagia]QFY58109.1 hypothetical protein EAO82_18080 [Halopseudomonas pelagia]
MNRKAARRLTKMVIYSRGIALIELMIAMVLGLVIIGAVTGIMLSNIQGFRTTRGLSQLQDSARVGYELLARDIRQAGNVPCGNQFGPTVAGIQPFRIVNILNGSQAGPNADVPWQYDFDNAFIGFEADEELEGLNNQIPGTESLVILSGDANGTYMETYDTDNNSANFTVATADGSPPSFNDGEILLACNQKQGTIFQASNGSGNNANRLVVNTGNNQQPGNCTKGLGYPGEGQTLCTTNGTRADYGPNTVIAKLNSTAWYIGDNNRPDEGGRSLYMAKLGVNASGNAELIPIEIAAGVTDMRLRYRLRGGAEFVDADAVGSQWAEVNAVEITLDLLSQDQNISTSTGVEQGRIGRGFTSIVAIRNRSL